MSPLRRSRAPYRFTGFLFVLLTLQPILFIAENTVFYLFSKGAAPSLLYTDVVRPKPWTIFIIIGDFSFLVCSGAYSSLCVHRENLNCFAWRSVKLLDNLWLGVCLTEPKGWPMLPRNLHTIYQMSCTSLRNNGFKCFSL